MDLGKDGQAPERLAPLFRGFFAQADTRFAEKLMTTSHVGKFYINDSDFNYSYLVPWVIFVDPVRCRYLSKPQMVSARMEL